MFNKNNTGKYNSGSVLIDNEFSTLLPVTVDKTNGYAVKRINGKKQYLHRYVVGAKVGDVVDHINKNKLDNRKKNLRIVSKSENNRNKKVKGYALTPYGKYQVTISRNNKTEYIGNYRTKQEALLARNGAL